MEVEEFMKKFRVYQEDLMVRHLSADENVCPECGCRRKKSREKYSIYGDKK